MLIFNGKRFEETSAESLKGCYSAWLVAYDSAKQIHDWIRFLGVQEPVPPCEMHATVMYSKDKGVDEALHGCRPLRVPQLVSPSAPRHTTVFEKDGAPGALVLEFYHRPISARHEFFRDVLGCEHGFPEYRAHVTLSYELQATPQSVIYRLIQNPVPHPIVFNAEKVAYCNQ